MPQDPTQDVFSSDPPVESQVRQYYERQNTAPAAPQDPVQNQVRQYYAKRDQQLNRQLMQAIAGAAGTNHDAAGEAQRLGFQTGVGPDIAQRNMDLVRQRAAVMDAQNRSLAASSPVLARQLTDPQFADIALDQLDNLSKTESLFGWLKRQSPLTVSMAGGVVPEIGISPDITGQYEAGHLTYEKGLLGNKAQEGRATADDWGRIDEISRRLREIGSPASVAGNLANMAGTMAPQGPFVLGAGLVGGVIGGAIGGAGGPAAPALVPSGAAEGFSAAASAAMGERGYSMMAGNAYLDMLNRGVSHDTAKWAAAGAGLVGGALQSGGARIIGAMPGVQALSSAATEAISKAAGMEIADAMTQPTVNLAVKSALGRFLASSAEGGGLMAGQELANQLALNAAEMHDLGKYDLETDEGRADAGRAIGQAFVNGAVTIGTLHAATGMVGFGVDMARAQDAERAQHFFAGLADNAAEAKVRERNPNAYENFIAGQAHGTGAENVYIDGQRMAEVLHQSGMDPERVDEALPGVRGQVEEAARTGGDVTIPTAQYAARLAGTDLGKAMLPHMRLDPDAMSAAEAAEFTASQKTILADAQARATQEMAGNEAFAQSARVVEGDVFDQLKATKTMPDSVARVNAQFMRDLVVTQAANLGVTPEEFYARYKPSIERAAGDDHPLNQDVFYRSDGKSGARGGFDPSRLAVLLNDKADFTTFAHELGHWYLTVIGDLAKRDDSPGRFKNDMGTLLNWFGVKDHATWDAMSLEEQRKYHEQFAYSFEKYLAEGKAPSLSLQGVFDRFKFWMMRVYASVKDNVNTLYRKEHGTDLPMMTGEVRGVMDRMLASDEQIRHAQTVRGLEPLFTSKEMALKSGMSESDWDQYRNHVAGARDAASAELGASSLRNMQWLSNAKSRVIKELQAQHDRLRAETRAEVEKQVRGEDLYRAQRWLKHGEMETPDGETVAAEKGYKLNAADVKAMFAGKPGAPDLTKLRGMMGEEGMHPDVAAPMFGYDNGEQLVRNLVDARPLKEEIDARTDQRMLEQHGDMNSPEELERRTNEALHNDARARMLATELKFVQRLQQPVHVLQAAARNVAQRILAGKRIGDISEHDYITGEAKAERAAQAAMRRGDDAGVAKAVQDRLVQNALAKEAIKVREAVDQKLKFLSKFDNPSKAITQKIGADYMDRINELLAGYQLSKRAALGGDERPLAQWVNGEYDKTGVMPAVSDELIMDLGTMHWKDMTVAQLGALHDAVVSLDYIGRKRTEVELEGKTVQVGELIQQVRENLAGVTHTEPVDLRADLAHAKGLDKVQARFLQFKGKLRSLDAALLKMEQLFQWLDAGKEAGLKEAPADGPMSRLFRLASNAEGKERAMRATSTAALRALGENLRGARIDLNEVLDVPELPRANGKTSMYREELLAVALNLGNESNREKLYGGYNWSDERVLAAVNRLLSKPEMDFVQGVWDHVGSYGSGIVELQRRQTGVTPDMIKPAAVITQHGVYPGGYYPVVYDNFLDRSIEEKEARHADQLFENNYSNPSTSKGHTIKRTGYKGPIYLSLKVISRHIDQVTHDLAWRESITDMNKVLTDPRLQREVEETYGREYAKQFRPWLQAMANDRVFNTTGDAAWESLIRKARTNATVVGIGFRLSTMLVHGTSALSNSIGEVGPVWFAKGVQQFMGMDRIQESRDFVFERSPEMANRMNAVDRNITEAINDINAHETTFGVESAAGRVYDQARRFSMYGVAMLDMASAMPTWLGAYLKGMAKEGDGGMNLPEADAIEYANRAVRNAHGGGGTKDLSAIQRDKGVMSLATMFYSFWNHMYNRQRDLGKGWGALVAGQTGTNNLPRLLARSFFYFVVPQLAHAMLKPGVRKDEEEGDLAGFVKLMAEEIGAGTVSGIPIVRDFASAAVNGRDYTITPLEQAGKTLLSTGRDVSHLVQGEPTGKRAFQNAAQSAGYAFGIPAAQPAATTKFLWDVMSGDADPQGMKDWWQGVMTGRIKER